MRKELLKIFFIFSPLLGAGILQMVHTMRHGASGSEAIGVYYAFAVLQVVIIAVVGLVWSFVTRNRPAANTLAVWGYGIMAGISALGFLVNLVDYLT